MSDWWKNELYSQFGEDGILLSYFRTREFSKTAKMEDVGNGFYVDVGAHHPYMLSNTWFFYQRGWRGINIEPTPALLPPFESMRSRDINLQMAIAAGEGEGILYAYDNGPTNTLAIDSVDLSRNPERVAVKTAPLSRVLDEYLPPNQEISFLSVDVEGLDLEVLRSNNWRRYRPLLIVVEHHESDVEAALKSELYTSLRGWGYHLYGWAQPSLIFARDEA